MLEVSVDNIQATKHSLEEKCGRFAEGYGALYKTVEELRFSWQGTSSDIYQA